LWLLEAKKEGREIVGQIAKIEQISTEIDRIVANVPEISGASFMQTFALAKAVRDLRSIFQYPEIKETVMEMMDNPLGFQTDQRDGDGYKKPIKYSYEQIADCCIAAMLERYRICGKEFMVIGGNMMPIKNGKFRKIVEFPGLSDFCPTTTTPLYEFEERTGYKKDRETVFVAKVQAFATWKLDGAQHSIGHGDDKLVFKIRVNAGMGDDGIVGKALSKLYTRVLMRLTGRSIPETDDIETKSANLLEYEPVQKIEQEPEYTLPKAKTESDSGLNPYGDRFPVICGNDTCNQYDPKLPDRCGQPKIHGDDGRMSVKCSDIIRLTAVFILSEIKGTESGALLIEEIKTKLGMDVADTDEKKWMLVEEILWGK
jgi:hypothetical protein